MDTLQLKMLVMGSVSEMKFLSSPDETMEMANRLYDWIMEEGKIKESDVSQLSLAFDRDDPVQ